MAIQREFPINKSRDTTTRMKTIYQPGDKQSAGLQSVTSTVAHAACVVTWLATPRPPHNKNTPHHTTPWIYKHGTTAHRNRTNGNVILKGGSYTMNWKIGSVCPHQRWEAGPKETRPHTRNRPELSTYTCNKRINGIKCGGWYKCR